MKCKCGGREPQVIQMACPATSISQLNACFNCAILKWIVIWKSGTGLERKHFFLTRCSVISLQRKHFQKDCHPSKCISPFNWLVSCFLDFFKKMWMLHVGLGKSRPIVLRNRESPTYWYISIQDEGAVNIDGKGWDASYHCQCLGDISVVIWNLCVYQETWKFLQ